MIKEILLASLLATTNINLTERDNTLPVNPYSINYLTIETDLYHDNLIWEDYYYLLYNLDNGEVRMTDNLTSSGITSAYEPNYQFGQPYGLLQYLNYQADIIEQWNDFVDSIFVRFNITQRGNDGYIPLNVETCLIGLDSNNNLLNEPYLAIYNDIKPHNTISLEWYQIGTDTFRQIENLFLVLSLERLDDGTNIPLRDLQINITPLNDICLYAYNYDDYVNIEVENLYADFLLHDYNLYIDNLENDNDELYQRYNELINDLDTLVVENEALSNQNNVLRLENEQLHSRQVLNNVFEWFSETFTGLGNFLDIEIAPNVRLSYLLAIPIIVGCIYFIIKVLKMGG